MPLLHKKVLTAAACLLATLVLSGCGDFAYPEPQLEVDVTEGVAPLAVTITNVTPNWTQEPEHPTYDIFELDVPGGRGVYDVASYQTQVGNVITLVERDDPLTEGIHFFEIDRGEYVELEFREPGEFEVTLAVSYIVWPEETGIVNVNRVESKLTSITITVHP